MTAGSSRFAKTALLASLAALLLAPARARATAEEFSSFSVEQQEEDDESLLDHTLTEAPRAWRDEWEHAPLAFRTAQGCLTAGQWFVDNELKLRSALGTRSTFDLGLRQSHDNQHAYDALSLGFRFPLRYGAASFIFQPTYDKSSQDFAVAWEFGADTTAFQLLATWTVEDMLNNFWAFRQTRVGQASEPYRTHPYEPQLRVVSRHDAWRAEVNGRWLTPSHRQLLGAAPGEPVHELYLWGTFADAAFEARAFGLAWDAKTTNEQAFNTDQPQDFSSGNHLDFRRQWSTRFGVGRAFTPRLSARVAWTYQERTQLYGEGVGPGAFAGIDRLTQGEVAYRFNPKWAARTGLMYDRISIDREGQTLWFTYGTRKESRAYLGLSARFGRVSVEGVEGIELDHEPYEVSFHHDKGFLKLQTTF